MKNSILIKNISYLVTIDKARRILKNVSLYCEDGKIKEIGSKRKKAKITIDAKNMVLLPGLINTHHHLFQTLFRGIDKLKKQEIIPWIKTLSELAYNLNEEAVYYACLIGLGELALSGSSTCADFLYLYPAGRKKIFEATIKAAKDIGLRFVQVRGYIQKENAGLWPDFITEEKEEILEESERVIRKYHDNDDFSMCQVALGPCGYYSTSEELLRKISLLARKYRVRLHTHFGETPGERISFLKRAKFLGKDVWLAHAVYLQPKEIRLLAKTDTRISYCPYCNTAKKRVAPIIQMAKAGIKIGIGVDGSASNDSSNLLVEARLGGRLQGLNQEEEGVSYLRGSQILEMLTLGGAACLGREKTLGSIEEGKAADFVLIRLDNKVECAGAVSNPLEAIFHTALTKVDYLGVNGKIIVKNGKLMTVNLEKSVTRLNYLAKKIIKKAEKKLGYSLSLGWVPFLKC